MNLIRLSLAPLARIAALTVACLLAPLGHAADAPYPTRTVRMILPNSPGSLVDTAARVVAEGLAKRTGQPFVVENLAGAGGVSGTSQLVRAEKDGYTVGVVSANHAINPALYKLPYDSARDLVPVTIIGSSPMVLVVHPKVPARSLKELITLAKTKPGQLNYGSAGVGTVGHLAGELMARRTGTDWLHVPYKGQSSFTTDLLGGQVDAGFLTATVAVPLIKSGKVVPLAITSTQRSTLLPEIATFTEEGVKDYAIDAWVAMLVPAGTPRGVIDKLRDDVDAVLKQPAVRDKLREHAVEVVSSKPDAAAALVNGDIAKYRQLIQFANIKAE